MNSEGKTATFIAFILGAALVSMVAMVSNCSIRTAEINGVRAASCLQAGGAWVQRNENSNSGYYCRAAR